MKNSMQKSIDSAYGWMFMMPFLLLLGIFYGYPVVNNIWLSLTDYSGMKMMDYRFVGLKNYVAIFSDGLNGLTGMLSWTFIYAASVVIISLILGTFIAVLLDKAGLAVARIYRGIFILPWVIPAFITLLMWRGFLNTSDGLVNAVLMKIGIPAIPWLTDPIMAKVSTILVMTWFSFPYFIIVAQGILKSIPRDFYEAADIDGASTRQSFMRITLPMVIRTMLPTLIMAFIMQFNQFGVYLLTLGEPAAEKLGDPGATDLLITYVFSTAFKTMRYDLAAAYSVIIFVFVGAFSLIAMKAGKSIGSEETKK
ncbi:MAG: carbohydrate ABC transporter permease [Saccharofermentanales bacterium]